MVQCSIANCSSNCSQKYKEQRMTFFALPSKRKETKYRGKKAYRNALNRIVNAQNDAWMKAINLGYQDGYILPSNNYNIRLCVWHFHPSTLQWDEKSHCTLKLGASPTVYLTKFAMENDEFKEEKRFPRTVGDPKDINIVKDNFLRNNYCNESPKLPKVTPDRDNRSMKRSFTCMQEEEERKALLEKNNSIANLKELYDNFPKVSNNWSIILYKKCIKMRRILSSEDNFYSAHQEVIICKDAESLSYNMRVSTPEIINNSMNSGSKITFMN